MSALDLKAIAEEFLGECGSCDAGMPTSCACPKRDYRPTMLELVREVERLRESIGVAVSALDRWSYECNAAGDGVTMRTIGGQLRRAVQP